MDRIIFWRNRGQGKKTWFDCVFKDGREVCAFEDIRVALSDGLEERIKEAASARFERQVLVVYQSQQWRDKQWEVRL